MADTVKKITQYTDQMKINSSPYMSDSESAEDDSGSSSENCDDGNDKFDDSKTKTSSTHGMANVIAKILANNITSHHTAILAKGQTDKEIKRKNVQRESVDIKPNTTDDSQTVKLTRRQMKAHLWETMGHKKPNALLKDYERQLQRIATRGVVQLFNAVEKQQSMVRETDKTSTDKTAKPMSSLSKGQFLDLLQGQGEEDTQTKRLKLSEKKQENKPKWSVLQENFMMGGSMKDWDKNSTDSGDD